MLGGENADWKRMQEKNRSQQTIDKRLNWEAAGSCSVHFQYVHSHQINKSNSMNTGEMVVELRREFQAKKNTSTASGGGKCVATNK